MQIKKITCSNVKVFFGTYSSYVHKCSINFLNRGDAFEYQVFGWTGNDSDPTIPFSNKNI